MNVQIDLKFALIISVLCILVVFIVLIVISFGVNLISIILYKINLNKNTKDSIEVKKYVEESTNIKFDDIKDEDMLIAAFVASIDAVEGKDNRTVKIKSIKRLQEERS